MARVMATLVTFLVALVLTTKVAAAIDCMSVESTIMPCSNFLRDPKPTAPGSSCCIAASHLLGLGDVHSLCDCLKPFTSGFLPSKAQLLPDLCNLPAFSPLVTCIASSSGKPDSFLPPVFKLPPFIPLPPFVPPPPPTA